MRGREGEGKGERFMSEWFDVRERVCVREEERGRVCERGRERESVCERKTVSVTLEWIKHVHMRRRGRGRVNLPWPHV